MAKLQKINSFFLNRSADLAVDREVLECENINSVADDDSEASTSSSILTNVSSVTLSETTDDENYVSSTAVQGQQTVLQHVEAEEETSVTVKGKSPTPSDKEPYPIDRADFSENIEDFVVMVHYS